MTNRVEVELRLKSKRKVVISLPTDLTPVEADDIAGRLMRLVRAWAIPVKEGGR